MLDKAKARQIAVDYSTEVTKAIQPDKIVFFGSFVNGTPHDESDIDIAVFVNNIDHDTWYKTRIVLQDLRWNSTFIDVEPHLLDEKNDLSGFADHVMKTGEVIYPLS